MDDAVDVLWSRGENTPIRVGKRMGGRACAALGALLVRIVALGLLSLLRERRRSKGQQHVTASVVVEREPPGSEDGCARFAIETMVEQCARDGIVGSRAKMVVTSLNAKVLMRKASR